MTNSSGARRIDTADKLMEMGFNGNIAETQVFGTSYVTARFLSEHRPNIKKVFVIGKDSIKEELSKVGITAIGCEDDPGHLNFDQLQKYPIDRDVSAIIVGLDCNFTYSKLAIASLYLQQGKVELFSCNEDAFDVVYGKKMPSAGCIVKALLFGLNDEFSIDKREIKSTLIGKPNPYCWSLIQRDLDLPKNVRTLMIGDRLDTDICFAN